MLTETATNAAAIINIHYCLPNQWFRCMNVKVPAGTDDEQVAAAKAAVVRAYGADITWGDIIWLRA
jgi:hypothetical protein